MCDVECGKVRDGRQVRGGGGADEVVVRDPACGAVGRSCVTWALGRVGARLVVGAVSGERGEVQCGVKAMGLGYGASGTRDGRIAKTQRCIALYQMGFHKTIQYCDSSECTIRTELHDRRYSLSSGVSPDD